MVSTALPAAQVRASISWGDGTVSSGTISGSPPELRVSGLHRWPRAGRYLVTITLAGPDDQALARALSRVHVRNHV